MERKEITREYIESCILQGADDIIEAVREGSGLLRRFNMAEGVLLCLEMGFDEKEENDIYVVPEKSVHARLVHHEDGDIGEVMHLRTRHDAEFASYYFAHQLGISY